MLGLVNQTLPKPRVLQGQRLASDLLPHQQDPICMQGEA